MPDADGYLTDEESERMGKPPEQDGLCSWCGEPLDADDAVDQGHDQAGYHFADWYCGRCARGEGPNQVRLVTDATGTVTGLAWPEPDHPS